METVVRQDPEGLVGDRGEAHVGDAPGPAAGDGRDALPEVVHVGHQGVDDDHELGSSLNRDVDVGGRRDAAVDELMTLDLDRLVEARQGTGGGDGSRDRHAGPLPLAKDDPLVYQVLKTQLEHTDKMTGNWRFGNDSRIKEAFWPEVQSALLGRKDAKSALADADRRVARELTRA